MSRKSIFSVALGAALIAGAFAGPVSAHHSVSAQFDYDKPFDFKGVLTRIAWINPHSYLIFDVQEAGKPVTWSIESHGVTSLRDRGLTRDTLKVGDTYEVKGFRARNGAPNGFLQELVTSTGKVYRMSSTDTGN